MSDTARQPYRKAVARALESWIGRDFRAGDEAMCMNFVRAILKQVRAPLAFSETARPRDGHWTGPELASSLAGTDLGEWITNPLEILGGDVLFFKDTYPTGFPPNTITHVALALGSSSSPTAFVHRPTVIRPVEKANVTGYWAAKWYGALRPSLALCTVPNAVNDPPPATDPEPARKTWKVFQGTKTDSRLLDQVAIDGNGRATMTAQVLAELTGHKLVINNDARAIRFEPL